jgi:RsiW-degrading membrane proteinase PrsW (M82 family)
MLSVIPALFIEKFIYNLEGQTGILKSVEGIMIMLAAWALTEELAKFLAAFFAGLQKPECDEPIDPPIYLITAALGFAAMENIIFLTNAMARAGNTNLMPVLLTGDLRFIGANLLHVATSAFVGISLSLCFFHPSDRIRNLIGGTVLATILHFLFNYFIIKEQSNLDAIGMTKIMLPLWLIIVVIIFMLEKIKREKILEADKKI